jgi:hypothetical protein
MNQKFISGDQLMMKIFTTEDQIIMVKRLQKQLKNIQQLDSFVTIRNRRKFNVIFSLFHQKSEF